jgi:hypothetical protein
MNTPRDIKELITMLGGATNVSKGINAPFPSTVTNWVHRDCIPGNFEGYIRTLCARRKIQVEDEWFITPRKRAAERKIGA